MESGQLIHTEKGWVLKVYVGKHENIITRFKAREGDEAYEFIPVCENSVSSNYDWLSSLLITKREPFLQYSINQVGELKEAILILDKDDTFDYTNMSYQLGRYVGEYIVALYLPTLSVDMIHSRSVIDVSDEETSEYERLEKAWQPVFDDTNPESEEWTAYRAYHHSLAKKYLKPKLEILVPKVYPQDMEMFKEGLEGAIWDCDFSWYNVGDDFFRQTFEGAWCSEIILTLDTKTT